MSHWIGLILCFLLSSAFATWEKTSLITDYDRARERFCDSTNPSGFYSTTEGKLKSAFPTDHTAFTGRSWRCTRAFILHFNDAINRYIVHQEVQECEMGDFADFVAFAGAHIRLQGRRDSVLLEMYHKLSTHTRNTNWLLHQVGYYARVMRDGAIVSQLNDYHADDHHFGICNLAVFNRSSY